MATGFAKQPNVVDAVIGCTEIDEDDGTKSFHYHFVDPSTGDPTAFVDLMWASYQSQVPDPLLVWWIDNECGHEIEVRVEFSTSGLGPPPLIPADNERRIPADKSRALLAKVRPQAWPSFPGTKLVFDYKFLVRAAGSGEAWQSLDPQLQLERPGGFSASTLYFTAGFAAGLTVGLALRALDRRE